VIESIAPYVNLFLVDLKLFNPVKHLEYTGQRNDTIIDNFQFLAMLGKEIKVRVPLIKEITDSDTNKESIREFVSKINPGIQVEYLDFNPLTKSKYQKMDIPFNILP
jgi:pyruvate formate lyase activating enzyme